ncbi:MAG: MATE family efflux transporter [Firmicutes bacterium]|nr:MATE family efflux transporter [Bacillota bacterium]
MIGMGNAIISGSLSIVINYILMAVLGWGILSSAIGMGVAYAIPTAVYLIYFSRKKKRVLHFVKPKIHEGFILRTCTNGSSEMVTNLAIVVVSATMNIIMGNFMGDNGIAAVSVIVQVQFLLSSMYIGYGAGVAPIFGYAYGEDNRKQIKNVFRISTKLIAISSVILVVLCILFRDFIVGAFIRDTTSQSFYLARSGFSIFAIAYLFVGTNIFSTVFFTSVSNGKISALISFLRTFLFIMGMLLVLPPLLGTTGVWLSIPIAETLSIVTSITLLNKYRGVYHYGSDKKIILT